MVSLCEEEGEGPAVRRGPEGHYLMDVCAQSQMPFDSSMTPWTLDDWTLVSLSQIQFTVAACSVTMRSISAHAFARSPGSVSSAASSIAWLISGTSSSGQLTLLVWMMFLPLNVGSR